MTCKGRSGLYCLPAAIVVVVLLVQLCQASGTTCISNQLSWYTSVVGESPCMTYQRLRQICNNNYKVPTLSSTPPGDRCNDQVSTCCCNTIAYRLSMLCMVCQQDTQNSGGIGIDAPLGTYDVYLKGCNPITNNSLPTDIQTAVCNMNIRIDSFLYDLGWQGGDWYYIFAQETAMKDHATHNNNTFTRCPDAVSSPSPTPSSPSPTSTSEPLTTVPTSGVPPTSVPSFDEKSKSKSNTPIIGGVLGGFLLLAIPVLVVVIWKGRRTKRQGLEGRSNMYERSTTSLEPLASAAANPLIPNRLVLEGRIVPQISHSTSRIWSNTSNPSQYPSTSTEFEPSFQHNDGGPFVPIFTLTNLRGLPPAYDPSWDSDRDRPASRRNRLSADSVSMPPSNFANSELSDDK